MISKTYYIAEYYWEFRENRKETSNNIYISGVEGLYGLLNPNVVLIGNYYRRPDWQEIYTELKMRKANIIYES